MTRHPVSSIAILMAVVLYVAIVCAAVQAAWISSDSVKTWMSGLMTMTYGTIGVAALIAIARSGPRRMVWCGFAVFGWLRTELLFAPDLLPDKLVEWAIESIVMQYDFTSASDFFEIAWPVMIMLYGFAGALVGKLVAARMRDAGE